MRTAIVIDSACDLPKDYIEQHDIQIMPVNLRIGSDIFRDSHDPEITQDFYRRYLAEKTIDAETAPLSVEDITQIFIGDLVLKYDRVLVVTVAQSRSQIFANAVQASNNALPEYRKRRQQAGITSPFYLTVVDSKTLFTGIGVLVYETIRLLNERNLSLSALRVVIEELSQQVHTYAVLDDLFYVRHRASKKGEKSVSLIGYHFGSLLDIKPIISFYRGASQTVDKERGFDRALNKLFAIARQAIDEGLASKIINTSYAGNPRVMNGKPAFIEFEQYAKERGIDIMLSVMSTTAGINVGPGAFSLSYITGAAPAVNTSDYTNPDQ